MGLITFINVAIGVSLGGLLYTIWPEHYFSWYPSIPFFYWVMAMAMTFFLDRVKRKNGDVTVTMYMLVRLRACWKSCKSNGNHRAGVRG